MGVTYIEHKVDKESVHQGLREIGINALYRNDAVYKECSYPKTDSKKSFKIKKSKSPKLSEPVKEHKEKSTPSHNDQFSWSKVYKSPINKRSIIKEITPELKDFTLDIIEQLENIANSSSPEVVEATKTVGTSVTYIQKPQNVHRKITTYKKHTLPKFFCPCCTGGGDDALEAPYMRSNADSYESIDLKPSNNMFHTLDLDASLMSIIHLHRSLKAKKTPKFYGKIMKAVLRNTYKNAVCLMDPLKST